MQARIYKSTGSWYTAKAADLSMWQCRVKGKMKIDDEIRSTNPIAVGDFVTLQIEDVDAKRAMIETVAPRKNYIVRTSPHNKHLKHIVAANLDLAVLIASRAEPRTSLGFIDRFLVTAEAYHIPVLLVFNKTDLLSESEQLDLQRILVMYNSIGYNTHTLNALEQNACTPLLEKLINKCSLLTGHSGVGKSTIVNQLLPHLNITTAAVSEWSGKGMHTTTFAEMHDLDHSSAIIDTPGIRELGIVDISKAELSGYFPEMKVAAAQCKFNNCLHINEPTCAILEGVKNGSIYKERYHSYLNILGSLGV